MELILREIESYFRGNFLKIFIEIVFIFLTSGKRTPHNLRIKSSIPSKFLLPSADGPTKFFTNRSSVLI